MTSACVGAWVVFISRSRSEGDIGDDARPSRSGLHGSSLCTRLLMVAVNGMVGVASHTDKHPTATGPPRSFPWTIKFNSLDNVPLADKMCFEKSLSQICHALAKLMHELISMTTWIGRCGLGFQCSEMVKWVKKFSIVIEKNGCSM